MHNQDRVIVRRIDPSVLLAVLLFFLLAAITQAGADRSHGLLWAISKPGLQTSYLFGTIHSQDVAVVSLPAPVKQAFDESDRVVLEVVLDAQAKQYSSKAFLMLDGRQLADITGQPLYDKVVAGMAARGIPAPVLNRMKPWAAAVTLSLPPRGSGQILDMLLYQQALQQGKAVHGLESIQEQLAIFDALSEREQLVMLRDAIESLPQLDALYTGMLELYRQRDINGLMAINESYKTQGDQQLAAEFQRRIIDERNELMLDRMQPLLETGNTFIAVGALHLPGEAGLLSLLEGQGYSIRKVY